PAPLPVPVPVPVPVPAPAPPLPVPTVPAPPVTGLVEGEGKLCNVLGNSVADLPLLPECPKR
ncbi:hypothetical protein, partial [Blastococcus atacamensis]|uniref:hypothetical protein n=1 Tax=Blastococcus atacamensis TaxID=2070508 RepID=UPI001E321B5B